MPKVALSYRRNDSSVIVGRIRDNLSARYGNTAIFMDLDNIPYGTDFRSHINKVLSSIEVLLVIVGPDWLGRKSDGLTRIHDHDDFVRTEVAIALERKISVIPILVNDAKMPADKDVPDNIVDFAYKQAAVVDSGRDFTAHMDRVTTEVDKLLKSGGWNVKRTIVFGATAGFISLMTVQAAFMSILNPDFVGLWALMFGYTNVFIAIYLLPSVITAIIVALSLRAGWRAYTFGLFLASFIIYTGLSLIGFAMVSRPFSSIYWILLWSLAWSLGFVSIYYCLAYWFRGPRLRFRNASSRT